MVDERLLVRDGWRATVGAMVAAQESLSDGLCTIVDVR